MEAKALDMHGLFKEEGELAHRAVREKTKGKTRRRDTKKAKISGAQRRTIDARRGGIENALLGPSEGR